MFLLFERLLQAWMKKINKIKKLDRQISKRRRRNGERKHFQLNFYSCLCFQLLVLLKILPWKQIHCRDYFCTTPSLGDVLVFQTKLNQVSQGSCYIKHSGTLRLHKWYWFFFFYENDFPAKRLLLMWICTWSYRNIFSFLTRVRSKLQGWLRAEAEAVRDSFDLVNFSCLSKLIFMGSKCQLLRNGSGDKVQYNFFWSYRNYCCFLPVCFISY